MGLSPTGVLHHVLLRRRSSHPSSSTAANGEGRSHPRTAGRRRAGLQLPGESISLGFGPSVEEPGRRAQGGTVRTRLLLLEEVTMANKDKGGSKSSKTAASKSLKEKREAKKAKAAGSGSSSSANWTKK